MTITQQIVQDLAPDQSSLAAARKLLAKSKWPELGLAEAAQIIWGTCQGSGANPYYTVADTVDHGYKCTCPSRKFPCKHVLALLWQFAENEPVFTKAEPPEWVAEWMGRRRKKSSGTDDSKAKSSTGKNIHLTEESSTDVADVDSEAKQIAAAKRAETQRQRTDEAIAAALVDFDQWIADQLRTGMVGFLAALQARCRQAASRLVDAKAATLASRLDELPSRVLARPQENQPQFLMQELGRLVLLSRAWQGDRQRPDIRREISGAENREQILADASSKRLTSQWLVAGEQISSRRDGLISVATWLLDQAASDTPIALLQDYFPASAGSRRSALSTGMVIEGEVVFYPSPRPLRAVLNTHQPLPMLDPSGPAWPLAGRSPHEQLLAHLEISPWTESAPCLLPAGRIQIDAKGGYWWCAGDEFVRLENRTLHPLIAASDLTAGFLIHHGDQAELLSVQAKQWGTISARNA